MLENIFRQLDQSSIGAICLTEQGNIRFSNRSFFRSLGYHGSENDLDQSKIVDFIHNKIDEPASEVMIHFFSRKKETCQFSNSIFRFMFSRILFEGHQYTLGLAEPIEKAESPMEDVLLSLVHDIRSPLSAAISLADLLLESLPDGKNEIIAKKIIQNIERTDQMIREFLTGVRICMDEGPQSEYYDLGELAEAFIREHYQSVIGRFCLDISIGVIGSWPKKKLQKIFYNLTSNAIKYADASSQISLNIVKEGKFVWIKIHNFGDELSAEDQLLIFEKYYRASNARSRGVEGWGLGLNITKKIVNSLGGTIGVESSKSFGTLFMVKLPL